MSTTQNATRSEFRTQLFGGLPIFSTRLVRERVFTFAERDQVTGPMDTAAILREYFFDKDREEFVVCLLDTANGLIGLSVASIGGLAASIVEPRQIFKVAILSNAASLIVAHNHPSGNPEPSREDIRVTHQLYEAGKLLGIPILDHLIITSDSYTSFAEKGLLQ